MSDWEKNWKKTIDYLNGDRTHYQDHHPVHDEAHSMFSDYHKDTHDFRPSSKHENLGQFRKEMNQMGEHQRAQAQHERTLKRLKAVSARRVNN